MKIKKFTFLAILLATSLYASVIDHSITPLIEKAEETTNLNPKKYTKNQLQEITAALGHKDARIRVVSFNMLRNDIESQYAEANRWAQRLPRIMQAIEEMQPDAIGSQELSQTQVKDVLQHLPLYSFYGEPRADGECNGIFYRKDRFTPLEGKVWHLESTKHGVTMLQLQDLRTGKSFALFNTHLAYREINHREIEVRFILEKMNEVRDTMPIMFTGDLNTFPQRLDLEALPFYDGDYLHLLFKQDNFWDTRDIALLGHVGPISTFTNQPPDKEPFQGFGTPGVVLDHIYVSEGITILIHATQPIQVDGHFPSDHMPVIVDFLL